MRLDSSVRALKALVIFLGVLIVGGVVVIGLTIYERATAPSEQSALPDAPPAVSAAGFGARRIGLPQGADVIEAVAEGDKLILVVALPEGAQRVIVLDLASGAELGRFDLEWTE
jgi:hypothetical protein